MGKAILSGKLLPCLCLEQLAIDCRGNMIIQSMQDGHYSCMEVRKMNSYSFYKWMVLWTLWLLLAWLRCNIQHKIFHQLYTLKIKFWDKFTRNIQSNSVITNSSGPAKFVRYNRVVYVTKWPFGPQNLFVKTEFHLFISADLHKNITLICL